MDTATTRHGGGAQRTVLAGWSGLIHTGTRRSCSPPISSIRGARAGPTCRTDRSTRWRTTGDGSSRCAAAMTRCFYAIIDTDPDTDPTAAGAAQRAVGVLSYLRMQARDRRDRGRPRPLLAAAATAPGRDRLAVPAGQPRVRGVGLPTARMEVQRTQRRVPVRRGTARIHVRRYVPPGGGGQGPQPATTAWYSITDSEWPGIRDRFASWLHPDNFDAQGRQRTSLRVGS